MRINRFFPIICCIVLLIFALYAASIFRQGPQEASGNTATQSEAKPAQTKPEEKIRGLWVTYMELNMANEADKSERAFRARFEKIASKAAELKFNTIIAQVRPFCDALYKSKYFPHSHILSGVQGKDPGYDALKIMCEICKKHKLKIHAWINPYRVTLNETPNKLAENNPYYNDNPICIETESGIILDPSSEEARQLILNGIDEIVNNYDVDGIQFDDYFYPADIEDNDSEQYQNYLDNTEAKSHLSLEEWRKNNVNKLVAEAYLTVHKSEKNVKFGISPQGNLKNNEKLSADVINWCTVQGYIDYICPQIYFSLDNPKLSFENSLKEWSEIEFADSVELYIGLAGYKANDESADDGTWKSSNDILAKEYGIVKNNPKASGIMLYSYTSLTDKNKSDEINNLIKLFG